MDATRVALSKRHVITILCAVPVKVSLHAILYVTDFGWLADELDDGRTWRRMDNASGEHRQAVAACIAAAI
jgi:hypothetical protein